MRSKKQRRKTKRLHSIRKSRILDGLSGKTTVENKLTKVALLLNYAFEYGIDLENRVIKVTGEIDDWQYDLVDTALTIMEAESKKNITIRINSPGGCSYQAMAIVGRMKKSKCGIITEGYGHVMSAATLILASGTHKRTISRDGFFMWHEASYALEGRHSEMMNEVKQAEKEEKFWANRMADCSNKTAKWWYENGTKTNAYYNADQLLKMGVVDELF